MGDLPRRMMLKAMGALAAAPAVAPAAITRAIGGEAASAIMGAVSNIPAPPGQVGRGVLGNILWGQFRRAERVEYLTRECRIGGLDPDIHVMRSWSPAYKAARQMERNEAISEWLAEMREKLNW